MTATAPAPTDPPPGSADARRADRPATGPTWPRWAVAALVAVLVLARVVAVVALLSSGVEDEHSILGGDARRYEAITSAEGTPYRDVEVEYPPLALGLMHLVDRPTTIGTLTALAVSQLALELATAGLLAWAWSRRTAVVYLLLGTPMLVFPFPYVRIDLLSVFLAVLGLALLRRRRQALGGGVLALAVFAKIWPLVVAPVMVLRRQWSGLAAWAVTGAAALGAWVAWAGPDGISQILTFRGADGWQIESVPGIVLHALDPHGSTVQEGAWRTAISAPGVVRTGLSVLGLAVVAVAWWWAHRAVARPAAEAAPLPTPPPRTDGDGPTGGQVTRDDLVFEGLAPLAAVLSMLVFSTIISPQYVLWSLPFAALLAAHGDRAVGWLTAAIALLSTVGLGWIHGLIPGEWHAVAVIAARNLLLLVLLGLVLHRLRTAARRPEQGDDVERAPGARPTATAPAPTASPCA